VEVLRKVRPNAWAGFCGRKINDDTSENLFSYMESKQVRYSLQHAMLYRVEMKLTHLRRAA